MLADADTTVLITGETGTGKESWRAPSSACRRGKHDRCRECAAIPADLLESQPSAMSAAPSRAAVADPPAVFVSRDGTLFLDEIAIWPARRQTAARCCRSARDPVGGRRAGGCPILAATHRDLREMVRQGNSGKTSTGASASCPIHLPPLRERLSTSCPWAEYFLAGRAGRPAPLGRGGGGAAAHPWPGNVRELRNAIERAAALSRGR